MRDRKSRQEEADEVKGSSLGSETGQSFALMALMALVLGLCVGLELLAVRVLG